MPVSEVYNECCEIGMKRFSDKFFDLAIVDPPYRDQNQPTQSMRGKGGPSMKDWYSRPKKDFFDRLFLISQHQIIWGANNFLEHLPSTPCFIFWNKVQAMENYSDGELAWTSFDKPAKLFEYVWSGNRYGTKDNLQGVGQPSTRIHPTEKPIALYKWLLKNYAKPGDKILDTHLGSQSSRIAAYDLGFDFYGWEIDKDYFEAGNKRFEQFKSQLKIF